MSSREGLFDLSRTDSPLHSSRLRQHSQVYSDEPLVYIVILNWNNPGDTLLCLESVHDLDYGRHRVLVVDNASTDDSVLRIKEAWPTVELLETASNLGYAEGNNAGIRYALARNTDYVLILNNDVTVASDMLSALVEVLRLHPEVGMVGPKLYCTDPRSDLFATGSFIDWWTGSLKHRQMFVPEQNQALVSLESEPVDFLIGCALLIRREAIDCVGGFNSAYFLNYEDVEIAIRLREHGYQTWYVPTANAWHKISATLGQASTANTYYMTRNALLFFSTNGRLFFRWLPVLCILFRTLRTIAAWTVKREYKATAYRQKRAANLHALRDHFLRRYGEMSPVAARACGQH